MQAFLEIVIKGMVQHPDAVRITANERRGETVFEVHVHPIDMGRLVGRRGNTINAIRTLLSAGAAHKGQRCSVELMDEREPGMDFRG
ncbi:MAG: KH domain-containing protein [Verrucomicrobiales bacterium]|nr:KH domain-containing protein [Verrucomicrobiales bacterium]